MDPQQYPCGHPRTEENSITRTARRTRECKTCHRDWYWRTSGHTRINRSKYGEPWAPQTPIASKPQTDGDRCVCGARLGLRTPRQLQYNEPEQHECLRLTDFAEARLPALPANKQGLAEGGKRRHHG